jgi:hypothetical protein
MPQQRGRKSMIAKSGGETPPTVGRTASRALKAALLLLMLGVLYFSFTRNDSCLLYGLDGNGWTITLSAQAANRTPFSQTGVDALEGSFDAYFPLFVEYLVPSVLTDVAAHAMPGKALTYFGYAVFLFFAAYIIARCIGMETFTALLGGFLLPVMGLPVFYAHGSVLYVLYDLNPHMSEIIGLSVLMVAAFWAMDGRRTATNFALALVPLACLTIAILGMAPVLALMAPALALYGGPSLLAARKWTDNVPRLLAGLLLVVVPAALGMIQYLYSLIGYSAYAFFSSDFAAPPRSLYEFSILFAWTPISTWTILLGIAGAALTAYCETGKQRLFAWTHLAATAVFLSVSLMIYAFRDSYHGSSPVYFETCFWPYMLIFAAVAIVAGFRAASRLLGIFVGRWGSDLASQGPLGALIVTIITVIGVNAAAEIKHPNARCTNASFAPIQPTPITEILRKTLPLTPGARFNGLAATIDGVQGRSSVDWFDLHLHDYKLWGKIGNDLRLVGLWNYGIPTLFHYNTLMTPPYYLLLTDFLARPADRQVRSLLVLTQINEPMLQLWGVRYLITDVDGEIIDGQPALRLVELRDPNLGDYSPTEIRHATDFRSGLATLHDANFDARRIVVTDSALDGAFVPASGVRLTYETYGFHLHAESAARSLLVLPIQYSHCWTTKDTTTPGLFRADLMQLGVSFTGNLDADLVFRYGPVLAASCRIDDLNDMKRLRIGEAREKRQSLAPPP